MERDSDNDANTFHPISLAADRLVLDLIKKCKFTENASCAAVISNGSFLGGLEGSEINGLSISGNARGESTAPFAIDTFVSGDGSDVPFVGGVLLTSGFSQIGKSVVVAAAIDMIDKIVGPIPVAVEPSQSRSAIKDAIDPDKPIALTTAHTPRSLSSQINSMPCKANKNTSISVVSQDITKPIECQGAIGEFISHRSKPAERNEDEQREGSRATAEEERKQAHEQYVQERLAKFREFERRADNLVRR